MDPVLKWILWLMFAVIVLDCVLIYYRRNNILRDETRQDFYYFLHCTSIRQTFSIISPASFHSNLRSDFESFSKNISELLSCPHKSNITQKQINREMLLSCCNATGMLMMTRQNTDMTKNIPYESNMYKSYKMNEPLYNKLPEKLPWSKRGLGRCAVVGSGGILKNSSCGREIDSADYVIRSNLAPLNERDVGLKTSLITINPSQIKRYKSQEKRFGPLLKRVSAYGNASLIMPAFATPLNTQLSISALKTLWPLHPQIQVVFYSSSYIKKLHSFWNKRGLKVMRLSTGFMLINVALELCDQVHIYGYWPFDLNLEQKPLSHHYFDNVKPTNNFHSMPEEFINLLQLYSQGALTLHLQPCS